MRTDSDHQASLERQIVLLEQLHVLLQQERSALQANDYEQLAQTTLAKQEQILAIDAEEQRRSALQPADDRVIDKLLLTRNKIAADCRASNVINGAHINRQTEIGQRTLDILHGVTPDPAMYTSTGASKRAPQSRLTIQA